MHISVFAPFAVGYVNPAFTLHAARAAEDLGFRSLWVPEHVLLFDDYESRYPYASDGRLRAGDEAGVVGPLPLLAYLAAGTSRIRLGTRLLLVPQCNPSAQRRIPPPSTGSPAAGSTSVLASAGWRKSSPRCMCPGSGARSGRVLTFK